MIGIGINTGTSADAIDVAVAEFGRVRFHPSIKLLWLGVYPYPAELKQLFLEMVDSANTLTPSTWFDMAGRFDFGLGMAFSDAVLKAISASGIRKSAISFIGSHGQTVWHAPAPAGNTRSKRFATGSTIQLGNPSVITVRTGIPVVAHFRDKDIALGGQGAPLAPVLHFELFRKYAPAIVLNIGGIANITVLPSRTDFSRVSGFDTGPGNRLIDIAAEAYTNGRQSFDRNGRFARRGVVDTKMLSRLLQDDFIKKHPPKSTGRERYNKTYLTMQGIPLDDVHTIATLTAFTARSIAYNIQRFVKTPVKNIVVCGGGAYNSAIIKHLSELMHRADIKTAEDLGYNAYAIEPLLFAYLGYLGFNRIPVSFKNITGSSTAFVPGGIYYP
jgi:anhydro-N-acetylmuramic acid kinase